MTVIDARYRTRRNPAARAVIGASNGGNISLWMGYTHPEAFGNIGAQSSNIVSAISSGFQSSPHLDLKLYLDLGTFDIDVLIPLVRGFIPILQSRGYDYRYEEYNEGHSWGNWRAHIDNALEKFFPGPALVVDQDEPAPATSLLAQNYPNPFNGETRIRYTLTGMGQGRDAEGVSLRVYDVQGREVARLTGPGGPGSHTVLFDGSELSSGVYIYAIADGTSRVTRRMVLLK
jgi:hypothetical protein